MTLLTTTSKILTTKSWLKLAQPTNLCRGCVAETGSSTVVHVLRVSTAARDVLLTVTDTGEAAHVVLVLHSASAVRWRLAFVSREEGRTAERRTVALSHGSTVSTANVDVQGRTAERSIIGSPNISFNGLGCVLAQFWASKTTQHPTHVKSRG